MAKRRKIFSSYLVIFPNYSLRTFQKKWPGQVSSGHQSGLVDPTSEKLALTSQLELFTERFPLLGYSLQYQYVKFVYLRNCISVTWGQVKVVTFTLQNYGKIIKCVLLRVNESKSPSSFRITSDYLICNDPGSIYWQGQRKRSSEVMWGHQYWPEPKKFHTKVVGLRTNYPIQCRFSFVAKIRGFRDLTEGRKGPRPIPAAFQSPSGIGLTWEVRAGCQSTRHVYIC